MVLALISIIKTIHDMHLQRSLFSVVTSENKIVVEEGYSWPLLACFESGLYPVI